MRSFMQALIVLCLVSCGVKEAPSGNSNPQVAPGNTPIEGVLLTSEKKFLVKPSRTDFIVKEQLTVVYQIVDKNLEELNPETNLTVKYLMPNMPAMPVTPAKIVREGKGRFAVTYHISMEGPWDFLLSIEEAGVVLDTLKFSYEVPAES